MGTFHEGRGSLHGITVVAWTDGPMVYVGRCDVLDDRRLVLLDADVHDAGARGLSLEDYLRRAWQVGVFPRLGRVALPADRVREVQPLGQWMARES